MIVHACYDFHCQYPFDLVGYRTGIRGFLCFTVIAPMVIPLMHYTDSRQNNDHLCYDIV